MTGAKLCRTAVLPDLLSSRLQVQVLAHLGISAKKIFQKVQNIFPTWLVKTFISHIERFFNSTRSAGSSNKQCTSQIRPRFFHPKRLKQWCIWSLFPLRLFLSMLLKTFPLLTPCVSSPVYWRPLSCRFQPWLKTHLNQLIKVFGITQNF